MNPGRLEPARCPEELTPAEAAVWRRYASMLVRMGTLTEHSRPFLVDWCRSVVLFESAPDRSAPDVEEAVVRMLECSRELGLTPMARAELVAEGRLHPRWGPRGLN